MSEPIFVAVLNYHGNWRDLTQALSQDLSEQVPKPASVSLVNGDTLCFHGLNGQEIASLMEAHGADYNYSYTCPEDAWVLGDEELSPECVWSVRALNESDLDQVLSLDAVTMCDVAPTLDVEEYAWGVFLDRELVGYCTIGGADDPAAGYAYKPEWTPDALILSDVYVKPACRGCGVATFLINESLNKANPEQHPVFLTILDDRQAYLYSNLGFKLGDNGAMVKTHESSPQRLTQRIQSAATRSCSKQERNHPTEIEK